MPRHQQVDTQDNMDTASDSFQVPIKQKLLNLPSQACDMCGTFKSNHPTMTSALMLIAVFCLGIVTSAAVGKLFVTNSHYYVSTDPHAREIHQALDTLIGHYRGGTSAMADTLSSAKHQANSYLHTAKGAAESGYFSGKEGLASSAESARASLDSAKANLESLMHGNKHLHMHKSSYEKAKDTLASSFSDASSYASDSLQAARDSLLAGKDAVGDKIQDTLHPHENQFMKVVHEAGNKINNILKRD